MFKKLWFKYMNLNCPYCFKKIAIEDVEFDNWPDNDEHGYPYGWCYNCTRCGCSFEVWGRQVNKNIVDNVNVNPVSKGSALITDKTIDGHSKGNLIK